MSISEVLIKVIGIVLALVGFALLLSLVGISVFGVSLGAPWFITLLVGVLFLGGGIYIIRGGNVTI